VVNTDRDQHLTTEQLSALLDRQLSPAEQAVCNAHIESCQQCQGALASLRQTVALLRSMPQPSVPRSFALPTGVTYLQEPAVRQRETDSRRRWPNYVQRSLRAMSVIAAVIGFIFLLSGVLPLLLHGGGGMTTATSSTVPSAARPNESATHSASTLSPHQTANGNAATPVHTPAPGRTPAAKTEPNKLLPNDHLSNRAPPAPPIIDLNEPLVRQGVGFTLLILGIVGVIVTRRWALRRT